MRDGERDECVKVLADALLSDPGWNIICPGSKTRHKMLSTLCNEAITLASACKGDTWVATLENKIAGCFIWNPPGGASIPVSTYLGGLARAFPLVVKHPIVATRCVRTIMALDAMKPKQEVFYGVFLGCAVQGRGVGSRLVNQLIEKSASTAIYLETQNPENLKFYERLGFRSHGTLQEAYPDGPSNFGLLYGELQTVPQLGVTAQLPAATEPCQEGP